MSDGRSRAVTRTQYAPPSARIAKSKETFAGLEYGLIPFLEYYLPLFFDKTATFADYLPEHAVVAVVERQ